MEYETFIVGPADSDELVGRCLSVPYHIKNFRLVKLYKSATVKPDVTYYIKTRKRHRIDGPAMIDFHYGEIGFWINDMIYGRTTEYCKAAGMSDEETFMWVLRFGDRLPTTIAEYYDSNVTIDDV